MGIEPTNLDNLLFALGEQLESRIREEVAQRSTALAYRHLVGLSLPEQWCGLPASTAGVSVFEMVVGTALDGVGLDYEHTPRAGGQDHLNQDESQLPVECKLSLQTLRVPLRPGTGDYVRALYSQAYNRIDLTNEKVFLYAWIDPAVKPDRLETGHDLLMAMRFGFAATEELQEIHPGLERLSTMTPHVAPQLRCGRGNQYDALFAPERTGDVRWLIENLTDIVSK
jgi:hypothetical protein